MVLPSHDSNIPAAFRSLTPAIATFSPPTKFGIGLEGVGDNAAASADRWTRHGAGYCVGSVEQPRRIVSGSAIGRSAGSPPDAQAVLQNFANTATSRAWSSSAFPSSASSVTNVVLTQSQEEQGEQRRYSGRIRKMFEVPGNCKYGFIECIEARSRFGHDVYVHQKQLRGCVVGDEVTFTIMCNAKGEPQARNVMRSEDAAKMCARQQMEQGQREEALQRKRSASLANIAPAAAGSLMTEEEARNFQKALKRQ
eukprot:TRINITY_DN21410_c0_g1_i1.p1 TRINITY_DN21410_c0_g1~~TRINITY_DN21410_c0_g1_i1.p1  ORF type:complete len:253 (+),score=29.83 TRINITY_DN21410_c0_g1_i1:100-858(+)